MIYCLHICEYAAMTERVPRRASRTENTRRRLKARMGQAAGEVHSRAFALNRAYASRRGRIHPPIQGSKDFFRANCARMSKYGWYSGSISPLFKWGGIYFFVGRCVRKIRKSSSSCSSSFFMKGVYHSCRNS